MHNLYDFGRAIFFPLLVAGMVLGPTAAVVALGQNMTTAMVSQMKSQPIETMGLGPGYLAEVKDVTCPNTTAGAQLQAPCGQVAISCECDGAAFFAHTGTTIGTDGRSETNFDGNVRDLSCRSSSGAVVCDCWALCSAQPD